MTRLTTFGTPLRATLRFSALTALLLLAPLGCHKHRKSISQPNTTDYADSIQSVIGQPQLTILRWPDYTEYQGAVKTFYDDRNYELAWLRDLKPTAATQAFLKAFADANEKGLNPEDYDASRWPARLQQIDTIRKNNDTSSSAQNTVAQFDAAMTIDIMRYISNLRVGRVNPQHFNFDINIQSKKYDLAEFLSDNVVDTNDVAKLIEGVEPDNDQYRKTEAALGHYLQLARLQVSEQAGPLPVPAKPLTAGQQYPDANGLEQRLQLEGDLPGGPDVSADTQVAPPTNPAPQTPSTDNSTGTTAATGSKGRVERRVEKAVATVKAHATAIVDGKNRRSKHAAQQANTAAQQPGQTTPQPPTPQPGPYTKDLAAGVKHYQHRHGYTEDGKLTPQTVTSLNIPLTVRINQLQDSLERWRWLPADYVNAPLMVNLPEFVLRGYGPDHALQFKMDVIVGEFKGQHETPVFTHMMKYLIFRPFWNVPISIIKKDLVPHMEKSGVGYLASKDFETVDAKGKPVAPTLENVEHGGVVVRQKPGPKNALGLVKFMFPNDYDIYLHSTSTPSLFSHTRRDFSHGCVRVQKPDDLAVWVLQNTPGDWDLQKVQDAMNTGPDNHQVNLSKPIPIVIFYLTGIVTEDGETHFYDDIYGYDQQMQAVLAKGMPYPSKPETIKPNTTPGDTN
jgi:murein L,D-transpeptidase YcbB/YkuD